MAVDDLDALRAQLPDLFEDKNLPEGWSDEWFIVPVDKPDTFDPSADPEFWLDNAENDAVRSPADLNTTLELADRAPDLGDAGGFPGTPQLVLKRTPMPPPDAMAFYLPFHYFHPRWWGIYLIWERVIDFARYIHRQSSGVLSGAEAFAVAQTFLYGHEAFHHSVEAFATRLEVAHRVPMYRTGFDRLFRRTFGTDECIEEALASSFGYQRVRSKVLRDRRRKQATALNILELYLSQCGPGYRRAVEFLDSRSFNLKRAEFAELNHCECLSKRPRLDPSVWNCFSHGFTGISRVTSRVNYMVHAESTLAKRTRLGARYLRYRDLTKRLTTLGSCRLVRQGGRHEIWEAPNGHQFSIPRHPGDLGKGIVAKIIKQAGLEMSVSEFSRAKV